MKILGTAILIKPDELPERTEKGILVIPKNSKEMLPSWGEVIDCGPACMEIQKGDQVNFPRRTASVIVIDDHDYYITTEHRIFFMREKTKKQNK